MKRKFLIAFMLAPMLNYAQGIISTPANELITVAPGGLSDPDQPNFGVSVADPNANLDVECLPGNDGPSNLRFRNLPISKKDTMVLVCDKDGYVHLRAFSGASASGAWLVGGNTNGSLQDLGTLDNFDLPFITAGNQNMRLTTNATLFVGNNPGAAGTANFCVGSGNISDATSGSNMVSGWSNRLTNAGACVVGGQTNTVLSPSGISVSKGVALGWGNTLQDHNQYLIGAANAGNTVEYCGAFGVGLTLNQRGAWYIGGNSGTTLTNDVSNSLAIGWGGTAHTGLFNMDGLTLGTGISNTTGAIDVATARLDVNGLAFTSIVDGSFFPSGVRFRDLPVTSGTVLVLDDMGYVYNSDIRIEDLMAPRPSMGMEEINDELLNQVNELARKVEELSSKLAEMEGNNGTEEGEDHSMMLYPNPSSGSFLVRHYIPQNTVQAKLIITDKQGQTITEKTINGSGVCNSRVDLNGLVSDGTYFCTLQIDGQTMSTVQFAVN